MKEKVDILEKEKGEIMKIIEEIDRKKKRTFMRTFKGINELFSSNFSNLYTKGKAYLEIENKDDIFSGGVNIAIKLAKGKYFRCNFLIRWGTNTNCSISFIRNTGVQTIPLLYFLTK